jgi:hypothetical protein
MKHSHPHDAKWAPPPLPSYLMGPDLEAEARLRARLRRVLRSMVAIGLGLAAQLSQMAVRDRLGEAPVQFDFGRAWDLVARAMRWTRALQARLAAEAKAARARTDPDERLQDHPDWIEDFDLDMRPKVMKPAPDDCIAGLSTPAVVSGICTDLAVAAALMGDTDAAARIMALGKATRAMLGAAADDPAPAVADADARDGADGRGDGPVLSEAAAAPPGAPDSG